MLSYTSNSLTRNLLKGMDSLHGLSKDMKKCFGNLADSFSLYMDIAVKNSPSEYMEKKIALESIAVVFHSYIIC